MLFEFSHRYLKVLTGSQNSEPFYFRDAYDGYTRAHLLF